MKIKNLSFALLVLMASCQDKEDEMVLKGSNESDGSCYRISALYSTKHTIPVEEAQKSAVEMMDQLYGSSNGLKSAKKRVVEQVQVITKAKSSLKSINSQLPDTLAYVVSFADSAGFSIVSADDRVMVPVLACVEKGTYSSGMEIPGLQLMVQKAQNYVASSIEDFEDHKDACLSYLETQTDVPVENKILKAAKREQVGPYLRTKWGQNSPFNTYCPTCKTCGKNKSVTGCFPVAMGQIFAYHKRGGYSKGQWDTILVLPSPFHEIFAAQIIYAIGASNNAVYGCGKCGGTNAGLSWSSVNNGPWRCKWLENLGYNASKYDYSWSRLKGLLDKGPVLMDGDRNGGGHVWVVDGYQTVTIAAIPTLSGFNINLKLLTMNYAHINWGWAGECNGYFVQDCFDAAKGSYDNTSLPNSQTYNYTMNLTCTEIVPK